MTVQNELATAIAIVDGLPKTRRGGAFAGDVERFVVFLRSIPDFRPVDISDEVVASLRREVNRLLEYVEDRLENGGDSPAVQEKLASSIYGARRAMEQIEMWRRHISL